MILVLVILNQKLQKVLDSVPLCERYTHLL